MQASVPISARRRTCSASAGGRIFSLADNSCASAQGVRTCEDLSHQIAHPSAPVAWGSDLESGAFDQALPPLQHFARQNACDVLRSSTRSEKCRSIFHSLPSLSRREFKTFPLMQRALQSAARTRARRLLLQRLRKRPRHKPACSAARPSSARASERAKARAPRIRMRCARRKCQG